MSRLIENVERSLRRHDPAAARLIRSDELTAMEQAAREQMPKADDATIEDLMLAKALEVAGERRLGRAKS